MTGIIMATIITIGGGIMMTAMAEGIAMIVIEGDTEIAIDVATLEISKYQF